VSALCRLNQTSIGFRVGLVNAGLILAELPETRYLLRKP